MVFERPQILKGPKKMKFPFIFKLFTIVLEMFSFKNFKISLVVVYSLKKLKMLVTVCKNSPSHYLDVWSTMKKKRKKYKGLDLFVLKVQYKGFCTKNYIFCSLAVVKKLCIVK